MDLHASDRVPELRVGMVGHAFMGAAHSQAWRTASRFFDLPLNPRMVAVCGRDSTCISELISDVVSMPLESPPRLVTMGFLPLW